MMRSDVLLVCLPDGASRAMTLQPAMLFGGGGSAKPAEGGGDKKEGFNMGNMMEGLKKANEIGAKTKDLQKVMGTAHSLNIERVFWA